MKICVILQVYSQKETSQILRMNKLFYLSLLLSITTLASCGGANASKGEGAVADSSVTDSITDSSAAAAQDSAAVAANDTTQTANAAAEEPVLKLPTTEAQLAHMRTSGSWDKYQSGILPQMASDVPEYCEKLLRANRKFLIVDKGKMKVFLYDPYGNIIKSYGIACARNYGTKQHKGDSRTPEGYFDAEGVYDSTNWLFTNDAGYTSPARGVYGPRFIRVVRPVGIHGTSSPGSIGNRCSHGCIRVTNDNIMELVKHVEAGTPIIVSPGPKDMAVNKQAGIYVASVATEPGVPRAQPGAPVAGSVTVPGSAASSKAAKKEATETPAVEVAEPTEKVEAPSTPPADSKPAPAPASSSEE